MARISGVEVPNNKRVVIGLTYLYGIGKKTAGIILEKLKINADKRVKDLSSEDTAKIIKELKNYTIEGGLRAEVRLNIKRIMDIGCYRGKRHRANLPCRGQRTKNNARTHKGKKKTISNKKK